MRCIQLLFVRSTIVRRRIEVESYATVVANALMSCHGFHQMRSLLIGRVRLLTEINVQYYQALGPRSFYVIDNTHLYDPGLSCLIRWCAVVIKYWRLLTETSLFLLHDADMHSVYLLRQRGWLAGWVAGWQTVCLSVTACIVSKRLKLS